MYLNKYKLHVVFFIAFLLLVNFTFSQNTVKKNSKQDLNNKKITQTKKEDSKKKDLQKHNNPVIFVNKIIIIGNKRLATSRILKWLDLKKDQKISGKLIKARLDFLYSLGYFADIRVDFRPTTKKDYYNIIFTIVENPVIKQIRFLGNKYVSTEKLRSVMKLQEGDIFNIKIVYQDLAEIEKLYHKLGYIGVYRHIKNMSWKDGILTIRLKETIKIKKIVLKGNTVVKDSDLYNALKVKPGDLLLRKNIDSVLLSVKKVYDDKGYVLADLKVKFPSPGVVEIKILEAVLEKNVVEGNKKTKSYVVLMSLRLKKGAVLKKKYIRRAIVHLRNMNLFKDVSVKMQPGSKPGLVKLVWHVVEQKTGRVGLAVGYTSGAGSNRGGLTGGITLADNNISGRAISASLKWQRGLWSDYVVFGVYNPFINKNGDSLSFSYYNSLYKNQRQYDYTKIPIDYALYEDRRSGVTLSYGRRLNMDSVLYFRIRKEHITTVATPDSEHPLIAKNLSSGYLNVAGISYVFDNRDDELSATEGRYINFSFDNAGLGGDYKFSKYWGEYRWYKEIRKQHVLAFRLMGGFISGNMPLSEAFVLGGPTTLRAYTVASFYGDRMFLFNGEYRFPIKINGKEQMFSGVAFIDAGSAWLSKEKKSAKVRSDYGVGVRVRLSGFGVIRLDYAISKEQRRLVVGIGETF